MNDNLLNSAVIVALITSIVSFAGHVFNFIADRRAQKNKPAVDKSTANLNDATAAKTIGDAWDKLYNESQERIEQLEKTANDQAEIIRRQGETLSAVMRSMDKVTAENSLLKAENARLKERIGEQEKEIQQLRSELDHLKNNAS